MFNTYATYVVHSMYIHIYFQIKKKFNTTSVYFVSVRDVINIYRDCAWSWGLSKNSCVSVRDYQLTVRDRAWSWATFSHAHISSPKSLQITKYCYSRDYLVTLFSNRMPWNVKISYFYAYIYEFKLVYMNFD